MTFLTSALQSGAILLREGLEALLVIATLVAVLRRAGAGASVRPVYLGAAAAVVLSIAAAVVFETLYGGAHDDRLEALVMVVAAGLMLYMSGWLFLRQDGQAMMSALRSSADQALAAGTTYSLMGIAFLAVFREGAETILFLHALVKSEGGWNAGLAFGLVAAGLLLGLIFLAMQWLALRLPLRPVFLLTSAFLFVMSLRFIGGAVQELQEQALLPFHEANQTVAGFFAWIGANASWESVGAQAVLILLALASLLVFSLRQPARAHA